VSNWSTSSITRGPILSVGLFALDEHKCKLGKDWGNAPSAGIVLYWRNCLSATGSRPDAILLHTSNYDSTTLHTCFIIPRYSTRIPPAAAFGFFLPGMSQARASGYWRDHLLRILRGLRLKTRFPLVRPSIAPSTQPTPPRAPRPLLHAS
jgi:hypothetical protein